MILKDYVDRLVAQGLEKNVSFGLMWLKEAGVAEFYSEIVVSEIKTDTDQLHYYSFAHGKSSNWSYTGKWRIIGTETRVMRPHPEAPARIPILFIRLAGPNEFPMDFDQRGLHGEFFYDRNSTQIRSSG